MFCFSFWKNGFLRKGPYAVWRIFFYLYRKLFWAKNDNRWAWKISFCHLKYLKTLQSTEGNFFWNHFWVRCGKPQFMKHYCYIEYNFVHQTKFLHYHFCTSNFFNLFLYKFFKFTSFRKHLKLAYCKYWRIKKQSFETKHDKKAKINFYEKTCSCETLQFCQICFAIFTRKIQVVK